MKRAVSGVFPETGKTPEMDICLFFDFQRVFC